jgi:COP9 signalosome complex subunit 3
VLNPSLNTVPYLFALIANISAFQNRVTAALDGDALWQKIIFFLEQFDPIQIRYVGHEFRQTIARTVNLARHAQQVCLTPGLDSQSPH